MSKIDTPSSDSPKATSKNFDRVQKLEILQELRKNKKSFFSVDFKDEVVAFVRKKLDLDRPLTDFEGNFF